MKLLRFTLLINLLSLFAIGDVSACGGPYYLPSGYYMYRGYELQPAEGEVSNRVQNCKEWQILTSVSISIEEIDKVVYQMSYEDFEIWCKSSHLDGHYKFFQWIKQFDNEALEFLRLAKENEFIRVRRNSRWYYPSMKIPSRRTLEEIAEEALASTSERFRDRYLLQAVRALFTLGRFDECVDVWESEASKLPKDNLMRRMIQPYIAGAAFRLNHNEKAFRHFAELGDIGSMKFCAKKQGGELPILEMLYKYCSDRTIIYSYVQRLIRNAEPTGEVSYDSIDKKPKLTPECDQLYSLALKFASMKNEKNPAFWYYTAAFIDDMRGRTQRASDLLALAERADGTDYIKESIKVLRIYLDAKRLPYNDAYEERLFEQLKWLDKKICNNITPAVIDKVAGLESRNNVSFYYWNDMLRRIMLTEVCPRMLKAGKRVRALQLANMTDNRLLKLVGFVSMWNYDEDADANIFEYIDVAEHRLWAMHLEVFRHHNKQHNYIDYGNNFFHMIDSLDSKTAIAYYDNSRAPKSDFDRFLNARSYVGDGYLRDIVGTLSLREMNYSQAERYYAPIKPSFYGHLNVVQLRDPFSVERKSLYDEKDFRYKFAKRMCELQREIETATDENKKAMLMLSYAIGMFNSVGQNWSLTYYKKSCDYACCEFPQSKKVREQAAKIIAEAEATASDREIKAAIQYELCNFKQVAVCYPDTELGKMVRGRCDKLIDYHAERLEEWRYYY